LISRDVALPYGDKTGGAVKLRVVSWSTAPCCTQGRADNCQWGAKTVPIATMADGMRVIQGGNL
jgi:hypothetical protein